MADLKDIDTWVGGETSVGLSRTTLGSILDSNGYEGTLPHKGIVTYSLAANRQRPLAGAAHAAVFNSWRRFRGQVSNDANEKYPINSSNFSLIGLVRHPTVRRRLLPHGMGQPQERVPELQGGSCYVRR
jgi:hypothetical protein